MTVYTLRAHDCERLTLAILILACMRASAVQGIRNTSTSSSAGGGALKSGCPGYLAGACMIKTKDSCGPDTRLPKKVEKGTVLVWIRAGCTGASLSACLAHRCRITTVRTTLYHLLDSTSLTSYHTRSHHPCAAADCCHGLGTTQIHIHARRLCSSVVISGSGCTDRTDIQACGW